MHKRIDEIIGLIDDKSLKTVIERLMNKHHESFIKQPAGCSMHHAYDGGLLDHSCDTAITANTLVERYSRIYEGIDRSLVVAGAFLHDIGKINCYEPRTPNPNKPNSPKYKSSLKSRWHHHIPIGFHLIATETDVLVESKQMEEQLADHLLHIIISHHGRIDYRSNRTPDTTEAFLVSQADLIDAYMAAPKFAKDTYNK
jgi:3'-5' exoribonuclease